MNTLRRYKQLKEDIQSMKQKLSEIDGRIAEKKKRLHGKTIEEAKLDLEEFHRRIAILKNRYDKALENLERILAENGY